MAQPAPTNNAEDLRRLETSLPGVTEGAANMRDLQRAATRAVGSPRRTVVGLAGAVMLSIQGGNESVATTISDYVADIEVDSGL